VSDSIRDELELRRLVDAYGVAVDDFDPAAIAALFVPGGALLVYEAGSDELKYSYRDEGFNELTAELSSSYLQMFHLVANFVVSIDGDRAAATTYCLASHLRDHAAGPQVVWMPVRYRDRFVRTAAGWRFEERVSIVLWRERRLAKQWPPLP
jgi:SnoaL-like domain